MGGMKPEKLNKIDSSQVTGQSKWVMPYVSQAQAGYFHTNPEKVGGAKVVKHWDEATKGKHLPKRVSPYKVANRKFKKKTLKK